MSPQRDMFAALTPEDFAAVEVFYQQAPSGLEFRPWVDSHVQMARFAYAAAHAVPQQIYVLASATTERWYVASTEETLGQFTERVKAEARRLAATRLFTFRLMPVRGIEMAPEAAKPSVTSEHPEVAALPRQLYFYAITTETSIDPMDYRRVHGFMSVDDTFAASEVQYGFPDQVADMFELLPR